MKMGIEKSPYLHLARFAYNRAFGLPLMVAAAGFRTIQQVTQILNRFFVQYDEKYFSQNA